MPRSLLSLACLLILSSVAFAEPKLPANPDQWVNSVPFSLEALRGKGVVLYFYEEGCPNCAKRWPDLTAISKKFDGQPVVFMAVNSGSNRAEVSSYARENNIIWPVVVDADRSLEKECNVTEISLQNIYQLRIVKADGSIIGGNAQDLEASANIALQGAAWKVDPAGIPASLKASWLSLELGEFGKASAGVKAGLSAKDEETKAAAEKLKVAIDEVLTKRIAEATDLLSQGNKWQAFKKLEMINVEFKGYGLPLEAAATHKELVADEVIKNEQKAVKLLDAAKKIGARGGDASVKRAVAQLEMLVNTMPDTEAAGDAKKIIEAVKNGAK